MKKILWLFLKATIIGFVVYLLLHTGHNALWLSIGYPSIKILNITLLSNFLDIVLLAVSFLIAIKVLYKNNKELIEQNINKLLILFFIIFSFFGVLKILLSDNMVIAIDNIPLFFALFYSVFIYFLFSVYFKILFNVFFLKKGVKFFWWTIGIFLSLYILNFLIYIIIFNKVYQNTQLPENFYLYPTIDIATELRPNQNLEGNSAEKLIELLNNLKNREIIKNSANENVITPTQKDLQVLEEISNKKYLSLVEQYVPENVIFDNNMIINLNNLRSLSIGIIESNNTRAMNNILILSHQLLNSKDKFPLERLLGIKMAQMSGEKLKALNAIKSDEVNKYLIEADEILANVKIITPASLSLVPDGINFYNFKDQALFFKFFEKYNTESEFMFLSNSYSIFVAEMPTIVSSMLSAAVDAPSWGTTQLKQTTHSLLIIPFGIFNKIISAGRNYIFYTKLIEIEKLNHDKSLQFLLNNDFYTAWNKYREDEKEIYDIEKELIPE